LLQGNQICCATSCYNLRHISKANSWIQLLCITLQPKKKYRRTPKPSRSLANCTDGTRNPPYHVRPSKLNRSSKNYGQRQHTFQKQLPNAYVLFLSLFFGEGHESFVPENQKEKFSFFSRSCSSSSSSSSRSTTSSEPDHPVKEDHKINTVR
jgi:hypothetical protein